MSFKSKFKTSTKHANEGVIISYKGDANSDGSVPEFKVARLSSQNVQYLKKLRNFNEEILKKYGVTDPTKISVEQDKEFTLDLFIETVLIGWKNIQPEDDGVDMLFSKENAKKLLSDPDWTDLYIDLREQAGKQENFSALLLEQVIKN